MAGPSGLKSSGPPVNPGYTPHTPRGGAGTVRGLHGCVWDERMNEGSRWVSSGASASCSSFWISLTREHLGALNSTRPFLSCKFLSN